MIRRLASALVLIGVCAAAVVLTGASDGESQGKRYVVEFDNAFGLVEGADVRVGGVRAGKITELSLGGGDTPKAQVEVEISEPGFDSFRTDATCRTRPQSLIGEYLVDCQAGDSGQRLPSGGKVPVSRTESTISLDLVNNVLRRPYRERLRLIISELGTGLAGRPDELRRVLRRAHPGLRETSKTLEVLGRQNRIIQDFITSSDTVVAELERRKADVARFVVEAGEAAEVSASRRRELAATFRRLPRFLDEFRPTLVRLSELSDEQIPLLADARRAAPSLTTFLTELGPFAEASRPAFRALGRASRTGLRAVRESRNEIDELRDVADDSGRLGRPLRQLLQSLDDRNRSIEDDPRAAETAPPPPDKNSNAKGKGFTGMEALLNYVYWQSLSLNGFDEISHVLRATVFESPCADYNPKPSEELQHQCGAYLGPYQPGVNAPDPTEGGERSVARARARDRKRPSSPEEARQRGAGDPEAPPTPGQPDPSKPQKVLPPELQKLLDDLREQVPGLPRTPELPDAPLPQLPGGGEGGQRGEPAPEQLLDFLLAR